jgi:hypothetical protein
LAKSRNGRLGQGGGHEVDHDHDPPARLHGRSGDRDARRGRSLGCGGRQGDGLQRTGIGLHDDAEYRALLIRSLELNRDYGLGE